MQSLISRFSALLDKSAWLLIAPFILALFWVDKAMALTLLQWLIFAPVMAGVAIIVSRIVFPQINLSLLVEQVVKEQNRAAGILAGALLLFVALLILALVTWAKA